MERSSAEYFLLSFTYIYEMKVDYVKHIILMIEYNIMIWDNLQLIFNNYNSAVCDVILRSVKLKRRKRIYMRNGCKSQTRI